MGTVCILYSCTSSEACFLNEKPHSCLGTAEEISSIMGWKADAGVGSAGVAMTRFINIRNRSPWAVSTHTTISKDTQSLTHTHTHTCAHTHTMHTHTCTKKEKRKRNHHHHQPNRKQPPPKKVKKEEEKKKQRQFTSYTACCVDQNKR